MNAPLDVVPEGQPIHVGIIMDGNGRWASRRNLPRTQGHHEGLSAAKKIISAASTLGIKYITLYTFSTENWKRAADEVGFLMGLIKKFLVSEFTFYKEKSIKILYSGDITALPKDIQLEIDKAIEQTAHFDGLSVILAINYGGQDEIIRACNKALRNNTINKDLKVEDIQKHLDNPNIPNPDLIIRTAGEKRLSNFLLWQSAYSELYFSDILWPDWNEDCLIEAIKDYQQRKRLFGGDRK